MKLNLPSSEACESEPKNLVKGLAVDDLSDSKPDN
jgi:hypothetical protein